MLSKRRSVEKPQEDGAIGFVSWMNALGYQLEEYDAGPCRKPMDKCKHILSKNFDSRDTFGIL